MPTRRQLIASTAGVLGGGTAAALFIQSSKAQTSVQLNGLSVSGDSVKTTQPVQDVRLSVDTSFEWDASTQPDRAVLRLKAKTENDFQQIDATSVPLEKSYSGSQNLRGSLMQLNKMSDLLPADRGESKTVEITVKVVLQLYNNGKEIATANAQDTAEITVTHKSVSVSATIGGTGEVEIQTETPTEQSASRQTPRVRS